MIPGSLSSMVLSIAAASINTLLSSFNITIGGPLGDGWGSTFYGKYSYAGSNIGSFSPANPTVSGKVVRFLDSFRDDFSGGYYTEMYITSPTDVPWTYMTINGVKLYKSECDRNESLDGISWYYRWNNVSLLFNKAGQTLPVAFHL